MFLRRLRGLFCYPFFLCMLLVFPSARHATADLALGLDSRGGGFVELLNTDFSSRA